jgi:prefoldin subunit 5
MFRNSPSVDQLAADLQKKSRQIDMLESTISKLNTELETSKKQIMDLRKVCFACFQNQTL